MKHFLSVLLLFSFVGANAQAWLWGRGNTGSSLDGWAVASDQAGNVFCAGINFGGLPTVFGTVTVPCTGITGFQCILAKYDGNGNILWAKGTQNGNSYLINIATDPAGNVYMFGTFSSATLQIGTFTLTNAIAPDAQYFLAKFDPSGNVLWAKNDGNTQPSYTTIGGVCLALSVGAIATDVLGNVYITTNFHRPTINVGTFTLTNTNTSSSSDDILLAKYDPSGSVVWAVNAGGNKNDDAYGITVTPAGDIYIAGVFSSPTITFGTSVISNTTPTGTDLAFIARFDALGSPVWACGSTGTATDYAIGLASDAANCVYVTGGTSNSAITFNGTTINNPYSGKTVLYLLKLDPSNNVSWYKTIGSAASDTWGYSIAMSPCGIVWVSGVMSGYVNIDGHVLNVPACSIDPIFIAGYNSSGVYAGSSALQSGGDDQNGIVCDRNGNVFMCCDYWGTFNAGCTGLVIGSDTLAGDNRSTELLYVAKFPSVNAAADKKHTDTTVCLEGSTLLNAKAGYVKYSWSNGMEGPAYIASDTGLVWVYGIDSCASTIIDTFRLTICDCNSFFVPNSFTPNGDGQNDVFYPRSGSSLSKIKSFRVYDRWGELVFERHNISANDASNAWDGSYHNETPRPEVYVWVLDAICSSGKTESLKGSVTIIK